MVAGQIRASTRTAIKMRTAIKDDKEQCGKDVRA
jgi:hypothetical protein